LKQYLRKLRAEGKADRTRSTAQHSIEKFLIWCGNRKIANFTPDDVYDWIDYISSRKYKRKGEDIECYDATICKEKTIIKKFMEHEKQITPEAVNLILDDLILKSESPNEYIDKLLSKFSLFDFVINAERVNSILN
jgi:hypothetical protein